MTEPVISKEPKLVRADEIKVGDIIDLAGDQYADRPSDEYVNSFEFELCVVEEVEIETTDCVRIGGMGFCVGFPVAHMLKVHGHDDRVKPELGRGAWVGYTVHDYGYTVRVYDPECNIVEDYDAGNHCGDSQVRVEKGDPARLPKQTLRKYAKQTAEEMAAQYGINLPMIQEEEDGD